MTLSNENRQRWVILHLMADCVEGGPEQNVTRWGGVLLEEMLTPIRGSALVKILYSKTYDLAVGLRAAGEKAA